MLTGDLEAQLADLKQKLEREEEEKSALDKSLALACQERDELQKVVDDLQSDLVTTQEAFQHVSTADRTPQKILFWMIENMLCICKKVVIQISQQKGTV